MSHSSDREETPATKPVPTLRSVLEGMERPDGMVQASEISLCIGGHFELDATPPGIRSMREIVSGDAGCDLLAIAGKGLLPVPTADVLVKSIMSNVDRPDTVGEGDDLDKCCGCGGCDKIES